jgi:hypothetical protein
MKKHFAAILITLAVFAAAFAWQTSVFGMDDEMAGHAMGIECLSFCLMAGADEADVAATVVSTVALAITAVVAVLIISPAAVPTIFKEGLGTVAGDPRLRRSTELRD